MCEFLYWDKGYRSFGDNIPGYAQGAYFPGDEPGWRCRLTHEPCPAESVEDEETCEGRCHEKQSSYDPHVQGTH